MTRQAYMRLFITAASLAALATTLAGCFARVS